MLILRREWKKNENYEIKKWKFLSGWELITTSEQKDDMCALARLSKSVFMIEYDILKMNLKIYMGEWRYMRNY